MKKIFDEYCAEASLKVTKKYSTSFFAGVKSLDKKIRNDVHAIYGLVRFADEIVDSFHGFNKQALLKKFKADTFEAIENKISLNPILQSFQITVNKFNIDHELIKRFFKSMEMDLEKIDYTADKYEEYILGSAEVVGLMCLKIFVYGDEEEYLKLKPYAMKLGSSFQKINFLRDLNFDANELGRIYFPNIDSNGLTVENKLKIEEEIQREFDEALVGIKMLPKSARFGVYVSYRYYTKLLRKIRKKTAKELLDDRIRISDKAKVLVFAKSYLRNSFNVL